MRFLFVFFVLWIPSIGPQALASAILIKTPYKSTLDFDLPMTYNDYVKKWIHFFQTNGKHFFARWLKRASFYGPAMERILVKEGLPKDMIYMSMIESGFSPFAVSSAHAVGPWQFIKETGRRYGLTVNWWLDERQDFIKSTVAASKYLGDMYKMFGSWYLAAAGYNTGENRIKRLSKKLGTRSFWTLADKNVLYEETRDYVPKLIAATIIAKSPKLYGFRDLSFWPEISYDKFEAPGGLNLRFLARHLKMPFKELKALNPALIKGYIPKGIASYSIRIPKGSLKKVASYVRKVK